MYLFIFFLAEDSIRNRNVTGVQTCALPISVSYFVVAECLTNIAKHSGATRASVFIAPIDTGVQIVVTDNGQGGARVDRTGRHTGIAGLIDRVGAARGTLNLTSPAGGPTTVVVEVPCAS